MPLRNCLAASRLLPCVFALLTVVMSAAGCGPRADSAPPVAQAAVADDNAPPKPEVEPSKGTQPNGAATEPNPVGNTSPDADNAGAKVTPADEQPPQDQVAQENGQAADENPQPADTAGAEGAGSPFRQRFPAPDFPPDMEWLNTGGPLRVKDLRGKFVLLDFWTYCCINCMHILPELKKLEKAHPNELVVIGVHSAKFETEQEADNIKEAILRYDIEHPVVNDNNHDIWNSYGVASWPTIVLLDPEGQIVGHSSGEFKAEQIEPVLKEGIAWYGKQGKLDPTPIRFDLLAHRQEETPLRFPGKVLADEASNRLFISDSNHHRIVVADLEGNLQETIGSGAIGANDGDYRQATFDHPQGMALRGDVLYVADTENHLLRKVDLKAKSVVTIAGTGLQARSGWPGLEKLGPYDQPPERWSGEPSKTAISSPWDLWIQGEALYIAMAGTHQIWKMPLDESEIGPYAGNGREDIVDGPLLPRFPYDQSHAAFAQPSGLTSDGQNLYVADSEGSSIRAVPFDPAGDVTTPIGTSQLAEGRLFEFGDVDGRGPAVRLQHPLGIAWHDGKIYIADTYNSKIKQLVLESGAVATLPPGDAAAKAGEKLFDEPAGLSYAAGKLYVADTNLHRIRTMELGGGHEVKTLEIKGLAPPQPVETPKAPAFAGTPRTELPAATVKPADGKISLQVKIQLPAGWKINAQAPNGYRVEGKEDSGPLDRAALGKMTRLKDPSASFAIELPVAGEGEDVLDVGITYYYCQEGGEGLCKVGSAAWTVPLKISGAAEKSDVELVHVVAE